MASFDASCRSQTLEESDVGISAYACYTSGGLGGTIKNTPEDFRVTELAATDRQPAAWPARPSIDRASSVSTPRFRSVKPTCLGFTLRKRGVDTLEALSVLARILEVPVKNLGVAGIKDSQAVTEQSVSLRVATTESESLGKAKLKRRRIGCGSPDTEVSTTACSSESELEAVDNAAHTLNNDRILSEVRDKLRRAGILASEDADGSPLEPLSTWLPDFSHADHPLLVHNLHWRKNGPLTPGQLRGNRFDLVIRGCNANELEKQLEKLERKIFFVNYIGLQRFGRNGVRSDVVGLAYLKRDYTAAFEAFLKKNDNIVGGAGGGSKVGGKGAPKESLSRWASAFFHTGSAERALELVPERLWAERRLLIGFDKAVWNTSDGSKSSTTLSLTYPQKCRYGFLSLPKALRILFVHAYVDRLWNLAASERLRLFNVEQGVVVGDLVQLQTQSSNEEEENSKEYSKDDSHRVKLITTPAEASQYSIFDVVIPRIGEGHLNGTLPMPTNRIGGLLKEYLRYDGVLDESEYSAFGVEMKMHIKPEDVDTAEDATPAEGADHSEDEPFPCSFFWTIQGTYRKLLAKPKDLCWERIGENDLKLSFSLGPGQYATMLVRELVRAKTRPAKPHVVFSDSEE